MLQLDLYMISANFTTNKISGKTKNIEVIKAERFHYVRSSEFHVLYSKRIAQCFRNIERSHCNESFTSNKKRRNPQFS